MKPTLTPALFLAYKSIRRGNRLASALMIFIMSLTFINLVFISSILNGIVAAVNHQVKTNLVSNIVIEPSNAPFINNAKALEEDILSIPQVSHSSRHYKLAGTMGYDKEKNKQFNYVSTEIIGVNPSDEKQINEIAKSIIDGEYLNETLENSILLGADLAGGYGGFEELTSLGGTRVGDQVQIAFSNGQEKSYTVRGIFKVKFGFADRRAYITSKEAESLLALDNSASQILVKTDNTANEDSIISQIQAIAPELRVKKWTEYMGPFGSVTESFDIISLVISAIGLAVAAITIFILIYINVIHKKRQIGIIKAIGVAPAVIIYSYILQALFYAIVGAGIGIGIFFLIINPYFTSHPFELPMGDTRLELKNTQLLLTIISLIITAFVAGLIPSWRGAKENILKAIWSA